MTNKVTNQQPWETVEYTDNPELPELDEVAVIPDVLPSPEALVFKQPQKVKITITLDAESVSFFKAQAQRLHTPYQRLIRNLLTEYANAQKRQSQGRR